MHSQYSSNAAHQRFVNRQTTGGVHQQHVKEMPLGMVQCCASNISGFLARFTGEPLGASLGRDGFQLLDGRRTVHVGGHRQHFLLALLNEVAGQLGRGGGFTRPLQTRHQNDCRGLRGEVDVGDTFTHGGGQLALHDAHQGLARLERAQHLLPQRLILHPRHEVAHHR